MTNLRELLPRNKYDTERAQMIVALGYPSVAPILPELAGWLKDYNWPVAQILGPFLAFVGEPLTPIVRDVLKTDDSMWKYWVLSCIVSNSPQVYRDIRDELLQIAAVEDDDEDETEVREMARKVIRQYEGLRI